MLPTTFLIAQALTNIVVKDALILKVGEQLTMFVCFLSTVHQLGSRALYRTDCKVHSKVFRSKGRLVLSFSSVGGCAYGA